jgi:NAD(P)-dependent dehydrogenase (short-subunit alcohol dehydrogenase family)
MNLKGAVALITGAGGGIASETARMLAAQGVDIAAVDLDANAAERTAQAVEAGGARAIAIEADVTRQASVAAGVDRAVDAFGQIDILVNAVGIGGVSPILDHPEALWDSILSVNLKSAFLVSRAVLPHLIDRGGGRVVNITSRAAYTSRAGTAAYAASKGGLLAFSRILAIECGPHGITVNNVAPGTTLTPMVENFYPGAEAQAQEALDSGVLVEPARLTQPVEIATAVLYLCGPHSDHISGATLHVNGGSYLP